MKKILALLLALCMVLALCACGSETAEEETTAPVEQTTETAEETAEPTEETAETETETQAEPAAVMSHEEYAAAELDTLVTVDTYVQATQSWWEDTITVYAQSEDGAYFIYDLACSEEDAAKLVPGTAIRVTGYKGEWSGEVEIMDGTFEFIDGDEFIAEAVDVTELLGTDDLIAHQNELVTFTGMTVEPSTDPEGNEVAFLYNWDGSGEEGSDLYFNVSCNGETYNFTVESYLCGPETEVYQTVTGLNVGDVVDMQGFLYWYEGVNPHITSVSVQG